MKQERNNEIDLLLRRLGRRPDDGVSNPGGGHLDADELSSYAENALPTAARSRYTEHLAQCSSCRTLVVQLSSAAGVVVAPERSLVPEPSGFRKFLASLLSPLVLRYAIPALGLAVIVVIGLTVFRPDQQQVTDVAQRSSAPAPANEQVKAPSAGDSYNAKVEAAKTAPAATPQAASTATPDAGSINMSKAPTPAPTALDRISAPVVDSSAATVDSAAPAPKPAPPPVANTPAASPTPAATEINERKVEVEKQAVQRQEAAREPQRQRALQSGDEGRRSPKETAATTASAKKKGDFSAASPQTGAGVGVQQDGRGEKDSDEAEIRTVAGRRFRKQRGVWVDTAYDSSTETTNLTRGSERYRAVVADEPTIKNIADQLDGEIIVVWKGRPYRIR